MEIDLDSLLDHISEKVYDYYHGFGPTTWVLDAVPLIEAIARAANLTDDEMSKKFDEARVRVYGAKAVADTDKR